MRNKIIALLCLLAAPVALCIGLYLLTSVSGFTHTENAINNVPSPFEEEKLRQVWHEPHRLPSLGRLELFGLILAISFVLSGIIYGAIWVKDLLNQRAKGNDSVDITGSCRYGTGYYMSEGVSFSKLTINPDFLLIQGGLEAFWAPNLLFCNFRIPKDQIIKISQFSTSLFGGRFQIEHNSSEAPPFIVFSTLRFTKAVREMEKLGYGFNWNLPT